MTQQAMDWMRELGFGSINLDLIYGLPHQTPGTFNETLDTVLQMKPDRLAVFSYAHVPWIKPAQKILEDKVLPSPESKLAVLKLVVERLTADNQYVFIGMDHFAKPTTNWPWRSATNNCNAISRATAPGPARTSTPSA